ANRRGIGFGVVQRDLQLLSDGVAGQGTSGVAFRGFAPDLDLMLPVLQELGQQPLGAHDVRMLIRVLAQHLVELALLLIDAVVELRYGYRDTALDGRRRTTLRLFFELLPDAIAGLL